MFNLNFNKLILDNVRTRLRKPKHIAWLASLVYPLRIVYATFKVNRESNLKQLSYNSQVFSIKKMLNDYYDSTLKRITITDGATRDNVFVFKSSEKKPLFLSVFVHKKSEYEDSGEDFIINIPTAVYISAQQLIELTSRVNRYKLSGMRFKVVRT